MLRRSVLSVAMLLAVLVAPLGAQAQTIAPAAPAEVEQQTDMPESDVEDVVQEEVVEEEVLAPAPVEAASIQHLDMVIEGEVTSVRTRVIADRDREYHLSDIAAPLRSRIEIKDTLLGYFRFQDGTVMTIDMSDGKVRANKIVLGKLPGFEAREVADPWINLNAVTVMTGTHASEDEQGRTVLTLDKQLKPQFGLELWVNGAPVDTFGIEPRTIGPILLVPLEPVVEALGQRIEREPGFVTVQRTQDQAVIQLELGTGLVSVNGTPMGVSPDIALADQDLLILPFSAIETLTGTHVVLKPGSNRVDVNLDNRLTSTALPGERITKEVEETPFTLETLTYELSDRGPLRAEVASHWGKYNARTRVETNGGFENFADSQPAWLSTDIQSLEGWAATVGDYNSNYRELAPLGQSRIRGGSWRTQKPSGAILAVAAGVPLTGASNEDDNITSPEFGGFAGGARLIAPNEAHDYGIAASLEEDGETGMVVVGGQKTFDFDRQGPGLQSAYVSGDIGAFSGDQSGADVRVRANANYAVSDTVGLTANASYDGEKFASGAGRTTFAGVFDQRVGARTAVSTSAFWRKREPWGALQRVSFGARASIDHSGGDIETTNQIVSGTFSTQIGDVGPSVTASIVRSNRTQSDADDETDVTTRVRALQRFDWGTINATYVNTQQDNAETVQQFVANVQTRGVQKSFDKGARVSVAPTASLNWNGDRTDARLGASIIGQSGSALGDRLVVSGRLSALSDFDMEEASTRFFGNLQARYRLTRDVELTAQYSDDFSGNNDLTVGLRGVVTFNEPRRHSLPTEGAGILTGTVYLDHNRDGIRQEGEPGVGGVKVSVRGTGLGLRANRNGNFTIQNIKSGLYIVTVGKRSLPLGYMVAESAEPRVTIGDGRRTSVEVPIILSGQVRGTLFVDDNANGETDRGEKRLEGHWIRLIPEAGGEPLVIQSASFGQYGFENVMPGRYRLEASISGQPVVHDVEIADEEPFVVQQIPVPPDLLEKGGGVDLNAGILGAP
ncbi:MAG: SdrD B-like domain-containing protein [Henriciella sp.]|nr:SdrD B-like domain-containing protein [Henriciella sp.]